MKRAKQESRYPKKWRSLDYVRCAHCRRMRKSLSPVYGESVPTVVQKARAALLAQIEPWMLAGTRWGVKEQGN